MARLLIDRGAKVNKRKNDGWTPLHLAAYNNRLKLAQLLIDNGADKNVKTNRGRKPIDVANFSEMKALLGDRDGSGKRP